MYKITPLLLVAVLLAGCKTPTIEPGDMMRIYAQTMEEDLQFTLYKNDWYYVGSKDGFDYVMHTRMTDRQFYRIEEGKLDIDKGFPRTRDKSKWLQFKQDISFDSESNALILSDFYLDNPTD